MNRKKKKVDYEKDCYACEISQKWKKPKVGGPALKLKGDWSLSHYADDDTFLGRMGLQPCRHLDKWKKFKPEELNALGENIFAVDKALRTYWIKNFPEDLIEKIYIVCFSEGSDHLHFHIIPRTKKISYCLKTFRRTVKTKDRWEKADLIAWDIYKAHLHQDFPGKYVVRIPPEGKEYQRNKKIEKLMKYLAKNIKGATVIK